MDVKEAVKVAKASITDLFGDQIYSDPVLEEVEFDDEANAWRITIGFLRLPEVNTTLAKTARDLGIDPVAAVRRAYKVVTLDEESGKVQSVKDREFAA